MNGVVAAAAAADADCGDGDDHDVRLDEVYSSDERCLDGVGRERQPPGKRVTRR